MLLRTRAMSAAIAVCYRSATWSGPLEVFFFLPLRSLRPLRAPKLAEMMFGIVYATSLWFVDLVQRTESLKYGSGRSALVGSTLWDSKLLGAQWFVWEIVVSCAVVYRSSALNTQ